MNRGGEGGIGEEGDMEGEGVAILRTMVVVVQKMLPTKECAVSQEALEANSGPCCMYSHKRTSIDQIRKPRLP